MFSHSGADVKAPPPASAAVLLRLAYQSTDLSTGTNSSLVISFSVDEVGGGTNRAWVSVVCDGNSENADHSQFDSAAAAYAAFTRRTRELSAPGSGFVRISTVSGGSADGGQGPASPERQLATRLFGAAYRSLLTVFDVEVSGRGIETPAGVLTCHQVTEGKVALRRLYHAVLLADPIADNSIVTDLASAYLSIVPHRTAWLQAQTAAGGLCPWATQADFDREAELLEMMGDLVTVDETRGGVSGPDAVAGAQLRMLGGLRGIDPASAEGKRVSDLLSARLAAGDDAGFDVKGIYAVGCHRAAAGAVGSGSRSGNVRELVHCSRPENWVGILSRGLALPDVVTSVYKGRRWDGGRLGNGLYFSFELSPETWTYALSATSSSCFLAICSVDLGQTFKTRREMRGVSQAPPGYDSVLGLAGASSDFVSSEYCVYDPARVVITHLVEFSVGGGGEATVSAGGHDWETVATPRDPTVPLSALPSGPGASLAAAAQALALARAPLAASDCGLVVSAAGGGNVSLKRVSVRAHVADLTASVVVFQEFCNETSAELEVRYVFPVNDKVAVAGFEAFFDGKHVVGRVREKAAARREYQEAVEDGRRAFLLEEEKADVFALSVGALQAGSSALIKIEYVEELGLDGDDIRWTFPAAMAPSAEAVAATGRALQSRLATAQVGASSGPPIDLVVEVDMPYKVTGIHARRHALGVQATDTKATVRLADGHTSLDDDLEILIRMEHPREARLWVEENDAGHRAAMVAYAPAAAVGALEARETTAVLVLIDLSSSMASGGAFDDAMVAAAAVLSLAAARPRTVVNVAAFGTDWEPFRVDFFDAGDEASLASALAWMQRLSPRLGGTNLSGALGAISDLERLGIRPDPAAVHTNVVVVSDGQVAGLERVAAVARGLAPSMRLFCVGVGSAVDKHHIAAIARRGSGGSAVMVSPWQSAPRRNARRLIDLVGHVFARGLASPSVRWVRTSREDDPIRQGPALLPTLFGGDRVCVFAFVDFCGEAQIRSGTNLVSSVFSRPATTVRGNLIHRLAVRAFVRDYEDAVVSETATSDALAAEGQRSEVLLLCEEYSIASSIASFVAVEEARAMEGDGCDDWALFAPTFDDLIAVATEDRLSYIPSRRVEPLDRAPRSRASASLGGGADTDNKTGLAMAQHTKAGLAMPLADQVGAEGAEIDEADDADDWTWGDAAKAAAEALKPGRDVGGVIWPPGRHGKETKAAKGGQRIADGSGADGAPATDLPAKRKPMYYKSTIGMDNDDDDDEWRRSSRFGSIVGSSTPSTTTATTASGEAIEDRRSFAAAVLPEEAAVGSSSLAPRNKSLRRPAVSMAATGIVSGDLPAQLQATVSNGLGLRGMDQSRDGDGVTGGDTGGDTGGGIGFLGRGQGAADAVPAHYRTTTTRSGRVIIKEPLPEPVAADSGRRASGKRGRRRSSRTKQTARKSTGGKAPRREVDLSIASVDFARHAEKKNGCCAGGGGGGGGSSSSSAIRVIPRTQPVDGSAAARREAEVMEAAKAVALGLSPPSSRPTDVSRVPPSVAAGATPSQPRSIVPTRRAPGGEGNVWVVMALLWGIWYWSPPTWWRHGQRAVGWAITGSPGAALCTAANLWVLRDLLSHPSASRAPLAVVATATAVFLAVFAGLPLVWMCAAGFGYGIYAGLFWTNVARWRRERQRKRVPSPATAAGLSQPPLGADSCRPTQHKPVRYVGKVRRGPAAGEPVRPSTIPVPGLDCFESYAAATTAARKRGR